MKRSHWHRLKNKWVIRGVVIILTIIAISWMRSGNKAPGFESTAVSVGSVTETVSVTGSVSPVAKASLAFEKGGVISHIYFKVGDPVKKGDTVASLDPSVDQAAVASAQATLDDMARGLTSQELAVQKASIATAQASYDNAIIDALNAAHDGFVKSQGAVVNYTDTLFNNAQSANPVINIRTQSSNEQLNIDTERVSVSDVFSRWSSDLSGASTSTATALISRSHDYLSSIKSFMGDLSPIVNNLLPGNSGLSQAQINADIAAMNSGLSALNAAIDGVANAQAALASARTALDQAHSSYDLKLSGNSSQSIAAQAAKVAQARAQLAQDMIVSPIDGIVTQADPHVGEFVAAGQSGFAVQNDDFKIEAFVPEADIAKIAVGDMASSTLDAYGSDTDFPAQVKTIDPAETVLEGVPTYKVTLRFVAPDARIRSGMTANLDILTHAVSNVLRMPYRAVVDADGQKSARLVSADGKSYASVPVTVGLKGSDGMIEVVSGLHEGDKVVTYVK